MDTSFVVSAIIAVVLVALMFVGINAERSMTPEQREAARIQATQQRNLTLYGPLNQSMICPHCQTQGTVHTKPVRQKKGISGGKTTAALLTGGLSLLATGLSRKETLTRAYCDSCNNIWAF